MLKLYPIGYKIHSITFDYTRLGIKVKKEGHTMNKIAQFVKKNRKAAGLTQEEFAMRSGLGLRFVRELEQGKETLRMDKVNEALAMFDMEVVPGRKENK